MSVPLSIITSYARLAVLRRLLAEYLVAEGDCEAVAKLLGDALLPAARGFPTERILHLGYGRRLLRCGISFWLRTGLGQPLPFLAPSRSVCLAPNEQALSDGAYWVA
jgi:hypothetical protein